MVFLGIFLIIVGLFLIYWNISYSPYKSKFDQDMRKRVEKAKSVEEWCTKEDIERLPEPLQRYCDYIELMEHSWGQKVVRFYDPDGNLIEVGTPM